MIILVDQDDVITNFQEELEELLKIKYSDIDVVPYEQRRDFYFWNNFPDDKKELIRDLENTPGLFRTVSIKEGAKQVLEIMLERGHDVKICTSPLLKNPTCVSDKYYWIETHLGEK